MAQMVTRNCEYCEEEFQVRLYLVKIGKGKFCSKSCGVLAIHLAKGHILMNDPERDRKLRERHPERFTSEYHRKNNHKSLYGIEPHEYESMYIAQGGKCAICRDEIKSFGRNTHVDHDHETGKVRSLLCNGCNTGIGQLKHSPEILQNAIAYLQPEKMYSPIMETSLLGGLL